MNKQILRRDMRKSCFRKGRALLHLSFLLLMLCLGDIEAWGQTSPVGDDLSGYYYIANYTGDNGTTKGYNEATPETNYYLCPAKPADDADENYNYDAIYYDGNSKQQPYLTTYRTGRVKGAIWVVEFATTISNVDYYYIKYYSDSKYLTHNTSLAEATNRYTVHLQTTAGNNNESLFCFEPGAGGSYFIRTQKISTGNRHLNPATGNKNYYYGTGAGNKTTKINGKTVDPGGMIGYYTHNTHIDDQASQWYLEKVKPTISYNSNSLIEISIPCGENATIYYTTNDDEPPTSGTEHIYSEPFDPADNVTTIKAVAVINNVLSGVTTLTLPVLIGLNHKRLIQSQNNGWTIDENTTDFHFYMIPGDEASGVTKVNTTSLFRPSMEWYFLNAGKEDDVQYYYIVNNDDSKNLCYDSTNGVYIETNTDNSEKFKFKIVESGTAGSFNIIPYDLRSASGNTARFIYKQNANDKIDAINITKDNNANSRWKFVLPSNLDKTAPFTVSNTSITKYYKIASVGSSGYYIIPPTGNNTNATTSNSADANVVKNGSWFFKEAQIADASDWLTYYYIRNAETGKYLYFIKDANNDGACLEMRSTIESGQEDRYMFTWAKTAANVANYYIVPKKLKNASQNGISSLQRNNGTLQTNVNRGAGNYAWTFESSTFHCTEPEITYDDANDQIEISSPQGAEVYFTIDGANNEVIPSSSTHYTVPITHSGSTQTIRAVCARSADGSDNSDVITVIFNPTITLDGASSITYDGNEHHPGITSVKINETTIAASEYSATPIYIKDGVQVDYCKDAGEYTVVVTDAVGPAGANYFVYGATTFTINKADINPSVSIENWSYNDAASTPVVTGNLGEGTVTYEYKPQGAADTEYSTTVPETRGNYTIRATIAASTNYNGSNAATADFTITPKSLGSGITPATGITIDDITKAGDTYSVPGINHNSTPLTVGTEGTAYDYSRTIDDSNPKYHVVTFTGANNYMGSVSAKFVNVNFYPNSANEEWAASFVINSSEGAFAMPTGYSAHIVTGASGNVVTAPALSYIPEDVPVILLSNASSNGFMAQPTSGEAPDVTDNKLRKAEKVAGTGEQEGQMVDPSFAAGEIYFLYNGEFVLNAAGTLAAGKVYLPKSAVSSGSAPSRLFINWGESTSINDTHLSPPTSHSSDVWYTLDGRRLNGKPTKKGLYLREGKKIVVR